MISRVLRLVFELLTIFALALLLGQVTLSTYSLLLSWSSPWDEGNLLSCNTCDLFRMALINLGLFALPLFVYLDARRYVFRALKPLRWSGEPWTKILLLSSLVIAASYGLYILSEWLIGYLPSSWGVSIEDAVTKGLEHLFVVGQWYEPLVMIFALAVVPAFSEELFFRGYLQRRLIQFSPRRHWTIIVMVSMLFSLVHFSAVGFLSRFLLALWLGYAYYRRDNIVVPMVIHCLNNLVTLAFSIKL